MNQSSNIAIEELKLSSVRQKVQFCFAKFEFIGYVCVHEQDYL